VPAIYQFPEVVAADGLMSYASGIADPMRQAAIYHRPAAYASAVWIGLCASTAITRSKPTKVRLGRDHAMRRD
jgi:hypothetical protein